jgi:hypothetical protein
VCVFVVLYVWLCFYLSFQLLLALRDEKSKCERCKIHVIMLGNYQVRFRPNDQKLLFILENPMEKVKRFHCACWIETLVIAWDVNIH